MEQIGFFEQGPGNRSLMRLLAGLGFVLGAGVVIWGGVLVTLQLPNGLAFMGVGAGILGESFAAKGFSKRGEG